MKSIRVNLWITGGILIAVGALMMRYPIEAILSAGIILGIGLIASGINDVSGWYFFGLRRFLVMGIIDIIAGLVMVIQPGISAFILPFVECGYCRREFRGLARRSGLEELRCRAGGWY